MSDHISAAADIDRGIALPIRVVVTFSLLVCLLAAAPAALAQSGTGSVSGRVFDGDSGVAIEGATVILVSPAPADGSEPDQRVATTGPDGDYEFDGVPAGVYSLTFIKSGYRAASVTDFQVVAAQDNVADFPLPRLPTTASGEILELDAFVVEASVVGDMMNTLELRLESDQLVNLLSSEDLAKFAASDVAEVLSRVAGVNVVEGQFAIVRGLEDRYSATLFNGAPVPSPDPDRQSVQLDLFPSDIVSGIELAKTFSADSPSNAAAGSIDIVTFEYPDEITFKIQGGTGFNDRALDQFTRYQRNNEQGYPSPIGTSVGSEDVIESDVSVFLGGRYELLERELRFKMVYAREIDFATLDGNIENRAPAPRGNFPIRRPTGDLALGLLSLPDAYWQLSESERTEQRTYFGQFGYDLDVDADHRVDFTVFITEAFDESVESRDDGFFRGFDYSALGSNVTAIGDQDFLGLVAPRSWVGSPRESVDTAVTRGQAWFAPVYESRTFERERDLDLYQLNGEHDLGRWVDGLEFSWVASYSETQQFERTFNLRYFFEPDNADQISVLPPGCPPCSPTDFSGGLFSTRSDLIFGENDVDENQYFARADLTYELAPHDDVDLELKAGFWFEQANRRVDSFFNVVPSAVAGRPGVLGSGTVFSIQGTSPAEMGDRVFLGVGLEQPRTVTENASKREITAYSLQSKATFWEDFDLVGGLRIENLRIESNNNPFLGSCQGGPQLPDGSCPAGSRQDIFPPPYVLFDRLDNPNLPEERFQALLPGGVFNNDELVGINVTIDPNTGFVDYRDFGRIAEVVNGEINKTKYLPSVAVSWRATDELTLRAAYSQTLARPSFRELGYYASLSSGTDDIVIGNPQLRTSDVDTVDFRAEYVVENGDLAAITAFYKTIDEPIEAVSVRDPLGTGITTYRTFRNNPSEAELVGVELEARKNLGFLGSALEYLTVGGNFTYIDGEVDQPQVIVNGLANFFRASRADLAANRVRFFGYERKRDLVNQPEWIANGDLTFDHPDWRTKATLSVFAISEVLELPAVADTLDRNGNLTGFILDRYTDSFYQLDFVFSQGFTIPRIPGEWTAKTSVKNITDSTRKLIYDQDQTADDIPERSFKIGRDYTFSLGYSIAF